MARNKSVHLSVCRILGLVDGFTSGAHLNIPSSGDRAACDTQLAHRSGSVRVASLFLAAYSLEGVAWNFNNVPTGTRGKFGDKLLAEELTRRNITLHGAITAFGENVGWKGNVSIVQLRTDPKFQDFVKHLEQSNDQARKRMLAYMAYRFAESRREVQPLPPVGDDVLTFARAKDLLFKLLALRTEGHVQQFLVAALLAIHRRRFGFQIRTHHPHAADKYDRTAGDIEELRDGQLVAAYEVTVRADWKNRVSDFVAKMDASGLSKYIILASNVNSDHDLAKPARLIVFLQPYSRDIAVVDLTDFLVVMAAELTAAELRESINLTYQHLCNPKLCGRDIFQTMYRKVVDAWLDGIAEG